MMSLDGYLEGPNHDVMAMPFDQGFDEYNAERLRNADTLLLGRTTFERFLGYWPPIADKRDAPAIEREVSRLQNAVEKVVVSDSLTAEQTAPWSDTRIVRRADAHHEIAELKKSAGRDIIVFGSHILWNDLLAHGLVDELHIIVGAGIVGGGTPAFESKPSATLRLVDTATWDGSNLVLLRYAVEVSGVA